MEIKKLNQELISRSNFNSFGGTRGDSIERDYNSYCQEVIGWGLSDAKTQEILDQIHKRFERILGYDAQHVSMMVAGPAKYNAKKFDKSEQILGLFSEFSDWFGRLEKQAKHKEPDKAARIRDNMVWKCQHGFPVDADEWRALAALDRGSFDHLYKVCNDKAPFRKNSVPYRIANGLIQIEQLVEEEIYSDEDFRVFRLGEKINIRFQMKPKQQLIYAMKSRKFHWIACDGVWRANYSEELAEWCKTIRERYPNYI